MVIDRVECFVLRAPLAVPVKVALVNTASPMKVAPLKSTLSSNLQDSNRIGGNRLPSNPPR